MKRKRSRGASGPTNVDKWLKRETDHKRKALENASRHFDEDDALSVNVLESIYGQESSFGTTRGKRNTAGAAGDFQLEKKTAIRLGLSVSKENDQRFDVDDASAASAKYLKTLDDGFRTKTNLGSGIETTPVSDSTERVKFTLAAYNAGEGRIANAQTLAAAAGINSDSWDEVKAFLKAAGASPAKVKEILQYVERILEYIKEFTAKSKADKSAKLGAPLKTTESPRGGHWITKDGKHILIR